MPTSDFDPVGLGLNTGVTDPALAGSPHLIIGPTAASVRPDCRRQRIRSPRRYRALRTKRHHRPPRRSSRLDQGRAPDEVRRRISPGAGGRLLPDRRARHDLLRWLAGTMGASVRHTSHGLRRLGYHGSSAAYRAKPAARHPTSSFWPTFLPAASILHFLGIRLGDPKRQVFVNTFALYAQDSWQVNKRL